MRPGFRSWKLLAALGIPAFRVFGQPSLSPSGTRVTVPISTDTIQLSASPTNLALADTTGVTSITLVSSGASPWGASAWRPDGGRAVYFLWGFPAVGLQTTPIIVNFGSGTPSVHALPPEPDRLPISASWSDEGNRLTVIDVRLDTLGLSDCRRRDFGVSSSALTLLNTTNLNTADFCASAGQTNSPLDDYGLAHAGNGGGGGGGRGGGGGGGGGVALSIQGQSSRFSRNAIDLLGRVAGRVRMPPTQTARRLR